GPALLLRLDGMFAFAVFHAVQRTLTLARDCFGVKPLYYALTPERLLFASEIKALFASGLLTPAFPLPAIAEYLTLQNLLGSYLSGGMDSGAIVSASARHVNRLRTFTLGMCLQGVEGMEARFDERAQAEELSNQFQTEHYTSILRPVDLPSLIPTVTWHLDD